MFLKELCTVSGGGGGPGPALGSGWGGEGVCVGGTAGTGRGVGGGQIGKVGGCLVVEGSVSAEEYFKWNPLRDVEPVEFLEDGGDVVMMWGC